MNSWRPVPVRELCESIFDGPHATPKKTATGPVFLGISCLSGGRLDLSRAEHLSEDDWAKWTRRVTPGPGDVVFSYETRLGEAAQIPVGLRCCLGRRMALMRPNRSRVDPRFLLYAYLSPQFQAVLRSRTVQGSTVDRILLTEFGGFEMMVPPLDEQRRIAAVLGALDDKIDLNRRMLAGLSDLAQVLFEVAAEGLRRRSLAELREEDLVTFGDGYRTRASELGPAGHPIMRVADVADGFVRSLTGDRVSAEHLHRCPDKLAVQGDVVVTTKGTVGRAALVEATHVGAVYSPQVCYVRVRSDGLSPNVVLRWARSAHFRRQAAALQGQTDMADYINLKDFGSLKMPVIPSTAEVAKDLSGLDRLAAAFRSETDSLVSLSSAMLPRLMSGDLRVRDVEQALESVM